MARCAECGEYVDDDDLVYNDYVGADVCPDCDVDDPDDADDDDDSTEGDD